MAMQITASAAITIIGTKTLSTGSPKEAALSSFIPWVKGSTSATFWSAGGMTSYGNVAPEKISMGKYNILAIIPAIFVFGATPPTIIPMLNIDNITKK